MRTKKKKKRLKLKTIIHRARLWLKDGNKSGAVLTVFTYTDYSLTEAEKFVDFIEKLAQTDALTADYWCDEHRVSRRECARQHPQEAHERPPTAPSMMLVDAVHSTRCLCGAAACCNQWHRLAMWIKDNPAEWQRLVAELDQRTTAEP